MSTIFKALLSMLFGPGNISYTLFGAAAAVCVALAAFFSQALPGLAWGIIAAAFAALGAFLKGKSQPPSQ